MTTTLTPAAPASAGRIPSTMSLGLRRIRIELKTFFRDRNSAVWNFLLPVLLLVIFGSVFGNQDIGPGITFAQYFVAGMIASGVVYTSFQNLAIAIPMERDDGTLKRLQGVPMQKASYFIGKIGLVFVAYVAQVTLLIIVGVLFYKLQLPTDPIYLSWTLAAAAPLPLPDRQTLLESDSAAERLALVTDLLRAEIRAMAVVPSLPATDVARTRWSPN